MVVRGNRSKLGMIAASLGRVGEEEEGGKMKLLNRGGGNGFEDEREILG